ncbi:MAG TPA: TfoX family protein [Gammaproteobacteria bacterium]|nr:TfoX family protein [Gammaproteobacteria bacterium]
MQSIGPVYSKGMFGGHGIFLDGLMFGLVADNELYLKTNAKTQDKFKEKGLLPFTYTKKEKTFSMNYYQAPEEALEDNEEMNRWANLAYGVAIIAAAKKNKPVPDT